MFNYAKEPLTVEMIFRSGWEFYKATFKYIWIWVFLSAIIYVAHSYFSYTELTAVIQKHLFFSWRVVAFHLLLLIFWSFFLIVSLHQMNSLATNSANLLRTIRVGFIKLIPIYIATLIYAAFTIIGFFLLLLPGIFIWILLAMNAPLIIFRNNTIQQSFINSYRLVWGNWWQTFIVLIVPTLAVYISREIEHYIPMDRLAVALIDILVLILITPFQYAVLLVQFNNLNIIAMLPKPSTSMKRLQS